MEKKGDKRGKWGWKKGEEEIKEEETSMKKYKKVERGQKRKKEW